MTKIVDLNLYKAKKEVNPRLYNQETEEFCYTAEYRFDGKRFSFDVWARTWVEAEEKLFSLKMTSQIVGKLVERD